MFERHDNILTAYVCVQRKEIVLPTPTWEEVLEFRTIMFFDDKGHQLSSGAFFNTRGEKREVEERIRCMAYNSLKQSPDYMSLAKEIFHFMVCVDRQYLTKDTTPSIKRAVSFLCAVAASFCFGETFQVNGVNLEYDHMADGIRIVKIVSCLYAQMELPDTIDNLPVVDIGTNACSSLSWIVNGTRTLTLPCNVKRIHAKAFCLHRYRDSISSIRFPATLQELDCRSFCSFDYHYNYGVQYIIYYNMLQTTIFEGCPPQLTSEQGKDLGYSDNGLFGRYENYAWHGKVYVSKRAYAQFVAASDVIGGYGYLGGELFVGMDCVEFQPRKTILCQNDEVTLSSNTDGAKIYYSLDSQLCTLLYDSPIKMSHSATIKAIVVYDDYPYTMSVEKTYSVCLLRSPVIEAASELVFDCRDYKVIVSCIEGDAVVRYTTDGSSVTESSPIYTAPFAISETTTVRAKAFKEDWFDSEETVQTFTRLWYTNETPVVSAAAEAFDTTSQEVTLSCDTEDATIYYTIDGSEPSATKGRVYKGPFDIYQTTTVKAIAAKDDWKDSAVASATYTKENAIGPAINMLEVLPDNDKTHPWTVVSDVTHDGVSAVKSGEIEDDESTTLKVTVYGAGELSFWWKTSCEPSIGGDYYDYATFYNGSTVIANLAGMTDWQQVRLNVSGTGKHTFKWTYQKDDSNSTVPDGMWLDQVQWLPMTSDYYADHTLTTETPVKYSWLRQYGLGVTTDFESAAKALSGKRDGAGRVMTVEDDFVAGTDPTNATSRLLTKIEVVDGCPRVRWEPDLNEDGVKSLRKYKVWGRAALTDDFAWECPTNALHHFFKVTVEMP